MKKVLRYVLAAIAVCVLALFAIAIVVIPIVKKKEYLYQGKSQTKQIEEEDIPDIPDFPQNVEEEPPVCLIVELKNEDIFEKGYYEHYFDTFTSGVVDIGSNNDPESDIEWKVYISDIKLTEDEIYALEGTNPVAVNKGKTQIVRGQWVYILCNINSQTSEAPSDSMFSIVSIRDYI